MCTMVRLDPGGQDLGVLVIGTTSGLAWNLTNPSKSCTLVVHIHTHTHTHTVSFPRGRVK